MLRNVPSDDVIPGRSRRLPRKSVFSPGGLESAQKFTKVNFSRYVIDALERKANYMQFYGRNFNNVDMCTL